MGYVGCATIRHSSAPNRKFVGAHRAGTQENRISRVTITRERAPKLLPVGSLTLLPSVITTLTLIAVEC